MDQYRANAAALFWRSLRLKAEVSISLVAAWVKLRACVAERAERCGSGSRRLPLCELSTLNGPSLACLFLLLAVPCPARAEFAGSSVCSECHQAEYKAWRDSHHGWAFREATPGNVLGNFQGTTPSVNSATSQFSTASDGYHVATDGSDGKVSDYLIRFTVGVWPLQQYVVESGKGRLQVLDTAWDAIRSVWYHLFPDTDVSAGNGLHWTGPYKNWQSRCGECHQTGFVKNYDPLKHSYASKWAELSVSCESCHGQASEHVEATRRGRVAASYSGFPKLGVGQQAGELAVCGPCHARREAFSGDSAPVGSVFADHYNLALLSEGLYFADGQQRDEVYILGSFLQSKMKARGVTCSNCHDPHTSQLIASGNALCTQCHNETGRTDFPTLRRAGYDTPEHHHHKPGSEAAQCVSCHMPARTYMRIDQRRDHFFRMPDPLQSKAAGSPDVCTSCHSDKSQDWAAKQIDTWHPNVDRSWQDRSAFVAVVGGINSQADLQALADYARDLQRPDIVRASAVDLLREVTDQSSFEQLRGLLGDRSDLVRVAAASAARNLDPAERLTALKPLLSDSVRAVRQAAAAELLVEDPSSIGLDEQPDFDRAISEYDESKAAMADTPESQMAIAGAALARRNWSAAEAAFNEALTMDPQLEEAWLTLSRLRAALGDQPGAANYIGQGLARLPGSVNLMLEAAGQSGSRGDDAGAVQWYQRVLAIDASQRAALAGLGISLLRTGRFDQAIDVTQRLLDLEPSNAHAYAVLAICYYAKGDLVQAKANAGRARQADPNIALPEELARLLQAG